MLQALYDSAIFSDLPLELADKFKFQDLEDYGDTAWKDYYIQIPTSQAYTIAALQE